MMYLCMLLLVIFMLLMKLSLLFNDNDMMYSHMHALCVSFAICLGVYVDVSCFGPCDVLMHFYAYDDEVILADI